MEHPEHPEYAAPALETAPETPLALRCPAHTSSPAPRLFSVHPFTASGSIV